MVSWLRGCTGMVSWLGKDEQDFGDFADLGLDFDYFGCDFGGDLLDLG